LITVYGLQLPVRGLKKTNAFKFTGA